MVARGVRAIVAREALQEFAVAARAMGASPARVVWHHLAPATLGFLRMQGLQLLPAAILAETTLSFAGLGFAPDAPSWGTLLHDASDIAGAERRAVAARRGRGGGHGRVRDQPRQPVDRSAPRSALIARLGPTRTDTMSACPSIWPGSCLPSPRRSWTTRWISAPCAPTASAGCAPACAASLLLGTNGEAPLIRDDEAVRLVDAAREAVPADRVLLVGTGRQATRDVIALSRAVAARRRRRRAGADAVRLPQPAHAGRADRRTIAPSPTARRCRSCSTTCRRRPASR